VHFYGIVYALIINDELFHTKHIVMKPRFFIGIIALLIWGCSPVKKVSTTSTTLTQTSQDSTEYEILIIDLQFDQWYLLNYSPAKDYSKEYYRGKNLFAVANWNDYYRSGRYSRIIESSIDYRSNVDYGIEVDRKLYWYFKFIVSTYKIRLFDTLPVQ
jgi:hypothetical protein